MTDQAKQAFKIIKDHNLASTSLLCRKMEIPFNKASQIMEELEKEGLVGPFQGSREREVLG